MKYIFEEGREVGKLPIKNIQIAFYDMERDGKGFDECFIEPQDFDVHDLMYVCTEDNDDDSCKVRVFVYLLDGRRYELLLKKV